MNPLLQQLQQQLQPRKYLIAFSGGLDSSALLSLLAKLREKTPQLQLRAVHIHHGLNPKADDWAQHCQQICTQLNIPLTIQKVRLNSAKNVEQQAREARYQAIAELRQEDEILVTAHHLQDQSETFLLALKRGSGIQGLGAMQTHSNLYGMPIFRPLLHCTRQQLADYVQQQGLSWIEDDSNLDNRYDRNFLRNKILPELRQRWQHFDQAVARSAQHCYEQQQLIKELLAQDFAENYRQNDRSFSIAQFAQYSRQKQNALLRMWLESLQQPMPDSAQLAEIVQNVIFARQDANPQFCLTDKVIRRYQQRLYLTEIFQDVSQFALRLEPDSCVELPDDLGSLKLQKIGQNYTAVWQLGDQQWQAQLPLTNQPIWLKFQYSGKVKLKGDDLNRDIKKIWQNLQVPPWQRQRIPLIFYGEQLQTAVGFFQVSD